MEINKETLELFKKDFQEAVKGLEEKYGVTIEMQGATYASDHFSAPIKVQEKGLEVRNWNKYAPQWGLDVNLINKTFKYKRFTYTIVGIGADLYSKYPIRTLRSDGSTTWFSVSAIREVMEETNS